MGHYEKKLHLWEETLLNKSCRSKGHWKCWDKNDLSVLIKVISDNTVNQKKALNRTWQEFDNLKYLVSLWKSNSVTLWNVWRSFKEIYVDLVDLIILWHLQRFSLLFYLFCNCIFVFYFCFVCFHLSSSAFFFLLHPDWRSTMVRRLFACFMLLLPYCLFSLILLLTLTYIFSLLL